MSDAMKNGAGSETGLTDQLSPCPSQATQEVKAKFRAETPRLYDGRLHFLFTSLVGFGAIGFFVWLVRGVTWLELLTIPITFLYANLAEWVGHRGPMHHRKWYAPIMFDGHIGIHHRFYPEEAFAYESHRDWYALLLPPYMILFFFGVFIVPFGVPLYFLFTPNVAYLFAATGLAYYLTYEYVHFCCHAPEDSPLLRLPFMRALRHHHLTHHNLKLMTRFNFNITFPICDWVFGTTFKRERDGTVPAEAEGTGGVAGEEKPPTAPAAEAAGAGRRNG